MGREALALYENLMRCLSPVPRTPSHLEERGVLMASLSGRTASKVLSNPGKRGSGSGTGTLFGGGNPVDLLVLVTPCSPNPRTSTAPTCLLVHPGLLGASEKLFLCITPVSNGITGEASVDSRRGIPSQRAWELGWCSGCMYVNP